MGRRKKTLEQKYQYIASKVQIEGECHIWTGRLRTDGFLPEICRMSLRRLMYFKHYGVTKKEILLSLCGNKLCINPLHIGTKENTTERNKKIIAHYSTGFWVGDKKQYSLRRTGKAFGITRQMVSVIVNNERKTNTNRSNK